MEMRCAVQCQGKCAKRNCLVLIGSSGQDFGIRMKSPKAGMRRSERRQIKTDVISMC
jgi:hypothetical protein